MSSVIDLSARPGERQSDTGPGQPQGSGGEGSLLATLCDHRFVLLTPTNVAFGLMTALFPAVVASLVPPCTPLYPLFHDGSLLRRRTPPLYPAHSPNPRYPLMPRIPPFFPTVISPLCPD